MHKYTVVITKSVQKLLYKLPENVAVRLEKSMLKLEDNPRPHGYKKLTNRKAYRIRVGNYRIIYEINDDIILVTVFSVGHRREVYK